MTPGERFKKWLELITLGWREPCKLFLRDVIEVGLDAFFRVLGKSFAPKLKPLIDKIESTGAVPPELQPLLDEIKNPTGEIAAILGQAGGSAALSGAINILLEQIFADPARGLASMMRKTWIALPMVMQGWQRGDITDAQLNDFLRYTGYPDDQQAVLKELTQIRLDPMSVVTAWRRDKATYEKYLKDLRDQGWSEDRIEALKFVTEFMPTAQDLVNWEAKEVFEPAMIAKYGLDDEFEGLDLTLFAKIGVTEEQALNYWRAHWEHASWNQVVEMVRRGQMTEPDVWDWFRLVEIPPFWRDKLIAISWAIPTRVDIRRFYDLKTIDEARLRELYTAQGYHGKDLDDYVLWTKIYVELPDLLARWKNGWITLDEVRSRLIADGMNADAADELIQTKVKSVEPTSTAEGKELTKTEIYKGVKQNMLTYDQGIDLLIALDYTSDQADYLLATNVAVLAGSPETLPEYIDLTQKYRKAAGLESKAVPYELQQAAIELVRITKERDRLKEAVDQEKAKLIPGEVLPTEATVRLKELEVALHRAESEVARIKQHYEAQLAEYKHGG